IRPVDHLGPRNLRKDDLVTDRRSVSQQADEGLVIRSEFEIADLVHQLVSEEERFAQWNVFAKRHEADLVVVPDRSSATDEERQIPDLRFIRRILGYRPMNDVDGGSARDRLD